MGPSNLITLSSDNTKRLSLHVIKWSCNENYEKECMIFSRLVFWGSAWHSRAKWSEIWGAKLLKLSLVARRSQQHPHISGHKVVRERFSCWELLRPRNSQICWYLLQVNWNTTFKAKIRGQLDHHFMSSFCADLTAGTLNWVKIRKLIGKVGRK